MYQKTCDSGLLTWVGCVGSSGRMLGWTGVCAHWHDGRVTASCHSHVWHGWGDCTRIVACGTWLTTGTRYRWGWRRGEETGRRRRWWGAGVEAGWSRLAAVILLLIHWLIHLWSLLVWCWHELLLFFWSRHELLAISSGSVSSHRWSLFLRIRGWILLIRARIVTFGAWSATAAFARLGRRWIVKRCFNIAQRLRNKDPYQPCMNNLSSNKT